MSIHTTALSKARVFIKFKWDLVWETSQSDFASQEPLESQSCSQIRTYDLPHDDDQGRRISHTYTSG
jgi:hypothetical protein